MAVLPAFGQQPFCLNDADGDGHPLFGNPEADLDAFNWELVPTHGAIGDLDGDGDPDAVSVNCWWRPADNPATQASILLNHGDGTFTPFAAFDPGDYPTCVAIGDLDSDGLNDLAITNEFTHAVSVLINAGGATFPSRVSFPTAGLKPHSVVIADLDGDGDADLAAANIQSNTVSVLLNSGQATFAPAVAYPVANIPDTSALFGDPFAFGGPYLDAADLDGDDDVDLAVPAGSGVSLLRNNGDGSFGPYTLQLTGEAAWTVAIGDVTCDGLPDLVTADYNNDSVSVLYNSGGGAFGSSATFSVVWASPGALYHPTTVALADLDGDCDLDIAVATIAYDVAIVLMNEGDGTFGTPIPHDAEADPAIVSLDDLNADGYPDLSIFTLLFPQERLCVRLNDGTGTLITDETNNDPLDPPDPWYFDDPSQIEFVDLDADSDLDLVLLSQGGQSLAVQLNVGGGTFTDPVHYLFPDYYPSSLVLGDLDGDFDLDIVVCGPESLSDFTPGRLTVLINHGHGGFSPQTSIATGGLYSYYSVGTDVDLDNDLDILTANFGSNDISVLLNDGNASLGTPLIQPFPNPRPLWIAAADLNADIVPDLVITKSQPGESVYVLWGVGDGTFVAGPAYAPSPHVGRVAVGDLDGDDDPDLVVTSRNFPYEPVTMTVLRNDGLGGLGDSDAYWIPGTSLAICATVSDLDLDGDEDVLLSSDGAVGVFLNYGDGSFGEGVSYGAGEGVVSVVAGDLDGDGDIDAGVANSASDTFSILWNRACAVAAPTVFADLDADGDVDLGDYALLTPCLFGPSVSAGECAAVVEPDLDGSGHIDLYDAALLFNAFGA